MISGPSFVLFPPVVAAAMLPYSELTLPIYDSEEGIVGV